MSKTLQVRRGGYVDSVTLMQVSKTVSASPGVTAALVAMATELNLDLATSMGFDLPARTAPNEMLVAVDAEGRPVGYASVGASGEPGHPMSLVPSSTMTARTFGCASTSVAKRAEALAPMPSLSRRAPRAAR